MTAADQPVTADIAAFLDGCTSTCRLLPEQEEGPYRRGEQPHRRDITEGRAGWPLRLGLRLRTQGGNPATGAVVEIWHCDAGGRYSGYPPGDLAVDVDPAPQRAEYVPEETFLRGRQTTDAAGSVEFGTIFPGWYPGRTVHIHLMVHLPARRYVSQLYFPEAVTAAVFAHDPYRHHGPPDTTHATDGIFGTGGQPAVLEIRADGDRHVGVICLVLPHQETA